MTDLIFFLTLSIPTFYAVWEDRKGDKHPNKDWMVIGIIMLVASIIVAFVDQRLGFWINLLRAFLLSFGIYALLFDYLVSLVLIVRGVVEKKKFHSHFSDTAWPDKWDWWRWLPWYGRLFIKLWIFLVCATVYFCPCKIQDYYNQCFVCH